MNLTVQQLVPDPLKEHIRSNSSDIWLREIVFRKGEHILIQAPSGTGKTTLLHLLVGVRRDYSGQIFWGDKNLRTMSPAGLAGLRASFVSVVFQDLKLFPELTVWENLELKRVLTQTIPAQRVSDMLDRLGIAVKKDQPVRTLSQGEKQRVAIIRALVQPFDWLLMDEPFSHLDSQNRDKASALIAEIAEVNKAGICLADLGKNTYFHYHKTFFL